MKQGNKATANKQKPKPAYRVIADTIEQMLLDGSIKPGEPLPSETEFAARFGVNRSTVREGIRLVEETGFVCRKSPRRLVASLPQPSAVAQQTTRVLHIHQITIREAWEVSLALEPTITRFAAARATTEQIEQLRKNIKQTKREMRSGGDLGSCDKEFHLILGEACQNMVFQMVREPLLPFLLPVAHQLVDRVDSAQRMLDAHEAIFLAIEKRDKDIAELWMRRHVMDVERWFRLLGIDFETIVKVGDDGTASMDEMNRSDLNLKR